MNTLPLAKTPETKRAIDRARRTASPGEFKMTHNPSGVFVYMVPVYVTVFDGIVDEVHVADETSFDASDCELIEGDPIKGDTLEALVAAATDIDAGWPAWEFGW